MDAIAILPSYLSFILAVDMRFVRIFRLLRLLKLTRYSSALATFAAALHGQRRSLGAALLVMLTMLILASSIAELFEKEAQPEAFGFIPYAMWWALATLTTAGYGDMAPLTLGGKLLGGIVTIFGFRMFAVPTGILATGFFNETRKRHFVATWPFVTGVPLFLGFAAVGAAPLHHRQAWEISGVHLFRCGWRGRGGRPTDCASSGIRSNSSARSRSSRIRSARPPSPR